MGIVIPIIKIDIEYINLIMVIHFTFSVTGSKQTRSPFSQKVSLGLVQTLEFSTISGCEKVTFFCSVGAFSKLVDFLSLHLQCHFPRNTTRDINTAALKPIVWESNSFQHIQHHVASGSPVGKRRSKTCSTYEVETPNNIYLIMSSFERLELNFLLRPISYRSDCS